MKRTIVLAVIAGITLMGSAALSVISRTQVPTAAIQSSVVRSPDLLAKAWALPVAATYREGITYQSNGSKCGPASVANALRSLGEEETTEAQVLADTRMCWTGFCIMGLSLDELGELAQSKTQREVAVLRNLTSEEFREHMRRANELARRYIINFDRQKIFGAGAGHHSPIGGYLEKEDLVFVLDVNENFKPWLVERERLFSAMDTGDGDKKRGLLLIE